MWFTRRKKIRKSRGHLSATRKSLRVETLENRVLLSATVQGDFDGDGRDDLAIGVPYEDIGSITDAGAVNVIYGNSNVSGLTATGDQVWHQNSTGVKDWAEKYDHFGQSLAVGDFNNDGYDDLAIGVPGEDIGSITDAGAVNVLYGSASGLKATWSWGTPNDQFWSQNSSGILEVAEKYDRFGSSLTAGDFNNDGRDDLAIGVPNEDVGSITDAGAVNVIYGRSSSTGLTAAGDQVWHQNRWGINEVAEKYDRFGSSLAAGDFNKDGRDDLAIGVPQEDIGSVTDAGAVNVIYGRYSYSGLSSSGDQFWSQNSWGINDVSEKYDKFGSSLTTGDFDHDGRDDLAIGVPYEDVGTKVDAGAVNVIYGNSNVSGLTSAGDQVWHQDRWGINDVAEKYDHFGFALAAGDFDKDGRDDLAIGVPDEDLPGWVIKPIDPPLLVEFPVIPGPGPVITDPLGSVLDTVQPVLGGAGGVVDAVGDVVGRVPDLVLKPFFTIVNAGAVNVIYGNSNATGLTSAGDQFWHQNVSGVEGVAQAYDRFGSSLAAADFNGNGYFDLAIGVPYEDVSGISNAGAVNVLYGLKPSWWLPSPGLSASKDQVWHQNSPGIQGVAEAGDQFGKAVA